MTGRQKVHLAGGMRTLVLHRGEKARVPSPALPQLCGPGRPHVHHEVFGKRILEILSGSNILCLQGASAKLLFKEASSATG